MKIVYSTNFHIFHTCNSESFGAFAPQRKNYECTNSSETVSLYLKPHKSNLTNTAFLLHLCVFRFETKQNENEKNEQDNDDDDDGNKKNQFEYCIPKFTRTHSQGH